VSDLQRPAHTSQSGGIRSLPKAAWMVITGIGVLVGAVLGVIQLVGWLKDVSEDPIRAEYYLHFSSNEGVLLGKFDPHDNFLSKKYTKGIVHWDPLIDVAVTGRAEDETVTLSPYLVVQVTDVRPIPERANYLVYPMGGGGGLANYFHATLAPEREGVFYAPQETKGTALGPRTSSYEKPKTYDYFTLTPGEKEQFRMNVTMLPGYYYWFRVGVQYSYKGEQGVMWSEREFVTAEPLDAEVWVAPNVIGDYNSERFKKFGDLQKYQEYNEKVGYPTTLPRYDKHAVQEAIMRQNEAVQEYSYPFTPPEQLNVPGKE
jgi:hypothetical protein